MSNTQANNIKNLHEMVFIYNAVMDGFTVRKKRDGKIKLKKKTRNESTQSTHTDQFYTSESEQTHTQQYEIDLEEFIRDNTQVEKIFR
jgi:predicted RNA-binding protein with RPS1 domain